MKKLFVILLLLLVGCGGTMRTHVTLETTQGTVELELYDDLVPNTAGNFKDLVEKGFYDGIIFHRVIPNFMIQGGDPEGRGTGGPGYTIDDEFHTEARNKRGTLSMANAGPNTGGSQFFINVADNTFLDYDKEPLSSKHAVFGEVVSGMEIVDKISQVQRDSNDKPLEPVVIQKAYVK